ncbi:hypothetical protein SDC9_158719 [bioreactor metagenome]|uniref:Uncharacterized protein n=1 Tax=bioreactor metagenome TaxID=1076179 RepID=A0A645FAL7_9ZZZZ
MAGPAAREPACWPGRWARALPLPAPRPWCMTPPWLRARLGWPSGTSCPFPCSSSRRATGPIFPALTAGAWRWTAPDSASWRQPCCGEIRRVSPAAAPAGGSPWWAAEAPMPRRPPIWPGLPTGPRCPSWWRCPGRRRRTCYWFWRWSSLTAWCCGKSAPA